MLEDLNNDRTIAPHHPGSKNLVLIDPSACADFHSQDKLS